MVRTLYASAGRSGAAGGAGDLLTLSVDGQNLEQGTEVGNRLAANHQQVAGATGREPATGVGQPQGVGRPGRRRSQRAHGVLGSGGELEHGVGHGVVGLTRSDPCIGRHDEAGPGLP